MSESNRKFVFGKLEIRRFTNSDYLYLLAFTIAVCYYLYSITYNPEKKFIISFFISWFIGFQTVSSPFGLRFRNIYFFSHLAIHIFNIFNKKQSETFYKERKERKF